MHGKAAAWHRQPLTVLWLLVLALPPSTCIDVGTPGQFAAAWLNSPESIVLTADIKLNPDDWTLFSAEQPCVIDRPLTVSSQPGSLFILDYRFIQAKCRINPNITVTYTALELRNTRFGSGQNIDFFAASPDGTVLLRNMVRRRPACISSRVDTQQLMTITRPEGYPGVQQVRNLPEACLLGECYQNVVQYDDFATVSAQSPDQLLYGGGYNLVYLNSTMVCAMLVPDSCVLAEGPDRCVISVINGLLSPVEPPGSGRLLAIVLPLVLGLPILVLVGGAFLWRHKRRRRQRLADEEKAAKVHESSSGAPSGNVLSLLTGVTPQAADGWRLMAQKTVEEFQAEPHDRISLGVLIGVGGHGRVYKGMWQNQEVAVKVLQHNTANAARVARECDLIMGFSHPHIVRAFHFVTWCQGMPRPSSHPSSSNIFKPLDGVTGTRHKQVAHATPDRSQSSLPSGSNALPPSGSNALPPSGSNAPASGALSVQPASPFAAVAGAARTSNARASGTSSAEQSSSFALRASGANAEHVILSVSDGGLQQGTAHSMSEEELDAQTWIVTEYCDGGSLYDMARTGRLSHMDGSPALDAILHRLREVADAMHYLHTRSVLHGDLKSANVLCASDPTRPYGMVAKVSDFGLSSVLVEGQTHRSTRTMGTVTHMAPETLRSGRLMPASDVYSFGILMWELLCARAAFSGKHYGEIIERVLLHNERPPVPPGAPEDYVLLMTSCWEAKPKLRPTFDAVRQCIDIMLAQRLEDQLQMEATAARIAATVAANPQQAGSGMSMGSSMPGSGGLSSSMFIASPGPTRAPSYSGRNARQSADDRAGAIEETSGFF